ncbi:MAG: TetR/AcrR family transcriptional regulator [Aeromicrobium sp.]
MSRLSEERLNELYTGTLALVAEHGFDKLTMDQIAEATKSSKATLYRQWGSKVALFVEALACTTSVPDELPDTGSLRGDLLEMFGHPEKDVDQSPDLVGAILHAMKQNEELAAAVRQQIIDPVNDRISTFIQRGIARGEIASDCAAIPYIQLALMSPFVLLAVLTGSEPDHKFILGYIDGLVLPALGIH